MVKNSSPGFVLKTILVAGAITLMSVGVVVAVEARLDVLAGPYDGTFDSVEAVNLVVGAGTFYSAGYFGAGVVIANVEAGHVWGGHEVFDRTGLLLPVSPALNLNAARNAVTAPDLGDIDFHATAVAHVLAGTGLLANGNLSLLGAGLAPYATLWSGAIATRFDRTEAGIGSFEISNHSFLVPYRAFFEGTVGGKADVINSSWGFGDPAGRAFENRTLDALAAVNPSVTFVRSAGNGGPTATPGVGFNGIVVGALGGSGDANPFLRPTAFTSSKAGDYFDPVSNTTLTGVRAVVDIAAPGEDFALAFYGGKSGSLADIVGEGNPATDLYYTFNQSGTSFSSPVVAGGIALLKEVANSGLFFVEQDAGRDSRVLSSVIQAGARKTLGWDNAQAVVSGVIVTGQALDFATGAGALDLNASAGIYVGGTTDVSGVNGGTITAVGWDLGQVATGSANDYFFDLAFNAGTGLTVALNWFVQTTFDTVTESPGYGSFADLNLSIWRVSAGAFSMLVASSESGYGTTEFLRLVDLDAGLYGLRVTHSGLRYDFTDGAGPESFGLAWTTVTAVPEPWAWGVAGWVFLMLIVARRARLRRRP